MFIHSDEEEAEEASEEKDKDSVNSADSSRNPTPKLSSKPTRTIDLGAAANYGKSENTNSFTAPVSSVAPSSSDAGNSNLVDLLSGPPDTSVTSQPFQTSTAPVVPIENDSFFADFSSAPAEGGSISASENFNSNNGKELQSIYVHLLSYGVLTLIHQRRQLALFIAGHLTGCGGADPHNSLTSASSSSSGYFSA